MKINELLSKWETPVGKQLTARQYSVRLPVRDAAQVAALAEMFPGYTTTQIITDLISAALDELEATLPYVQGVEVVSEDDHGDPIYGDAGPAPRFRELSRAHARRLQEEAEKARDLKRSGRASASSAA